jgi:hypothetical protein
MFKCHSRISSEPEFDSVRVCSALEFNQFGLAHDTLAEASTVIFYRVVAIQEYTFRNNLDDSRGDF